MLQIILSIIILLSSFPAGLILAKLTIDELVQGRKWFSLIFIFALVLGLFLLIFYRNFTVILTLIYIVIVSLICWKKSFDRKFVGRNNLTF